MHHTSILSFVLLSTLFLSGCSTWKEWFSFKSSPNKTTNAPHTLSGKTLSEQKLERILAKQENVLQNLSPEEIETPTYEIYQGLQDIAHQYQSFIAENREYLYGYILYGKFLRTIGDYKTANIIFIKANELEGNHAVIKQQIANYLAEEGEYGLALPYLLSAIELEPNEGLYHYQLGELLHTYREDFIATEKLTSDVIDRQLFNAFEKASQLAPDNHTFQMRYAESFFDVPQPDWNLALEQWNLLEDSPSNDVERDIIRLQKARVHIELGQLSQAENLLKQVDRPSLENSRQHLLALLQPASE